MPLCFSVTSIVVMPSLELASVLKRYAGRLQPLSPPEYQGNAGGASGARLWRFRSAQGNLVLRCWPEPPPAREYVERIHEWLREASDLGFLPVPFSSVDGRTAQEVEGRLWQLEPWMPGEADRSGQPPLGRVRAAFSALAALHARLSHHSSQGPSPGLHARIREVDSLISGGFRTLQSALDAAGADPNQALARRYIDVARGVAPRILVELQRESSRVGRLQPCLRDARPEHFLFQGETLVGLVDFGAMAVESVAADLARLMSEWLGQDRRSRAEALSSYEAIHPLDETTASWIPIFERSSALLIGGHWARWHFIEHRVFTDPLAVRHGLERGLDRLITLVTSVER